MIEITEKEKKNEWGKVKDILLSFPCYASFFSIIFYQSNKFEKKKEKKNLLQKAISFNDFKDQTLHSNPINKKFSLELYIKFLKITFFFFNEKNSENYYLVLSTAIESFFDDLNKKKKFKNTLLGWRVLCHVLPLETS